MKKIGFFGGSFDPIHFGHINLALELMEKGGLDEVLFCPVFCSPFKLDRPPFASAKQRLEMLELVLGDIPHCSVTDVEIKKGGASFTVDTLRSLGHNAHYRLLLADEAAHHLNGWKEMEEVCRLAPPLIGSRTGAPSPFGEVIQTSILEISSTEIRKRLKEKKYCGHLVPKIALDYIGKLELY